MKKAIALFLALIMVLSLVACGSSSSENKEDAEKSEEKIEVEQKPTPSIKDVSAVEAMAEEYTMEHKQSLYSDWSVSYRAKTASNFTISLIKVDTSNDNYTTATVTGYFYTWDEYGSFVDEYKYKQTIKFYPDGRTDVEKDVW